ncbi:MAG TPA: type II toxin-antitoxin system VapC family toxin [Bauldia sp.]|nr:type II toxin-antitoxin system VapC family toxin [Bauldia sp.]
MTLVDTNIVIDLVTRDPLWFGWSSFHLAERSRADTLAINEITYAELSVRAERQSDVETILSDLGLSMERIPHPALFLAGRAFGRYRQAGGPRGSVLPDFFIGAHAEVAGVPILTRDPRRYRTWFPAVRLIAPD